MSPAHVFTRLGMVAVLLSLNIAIAGVETVRFETARQDALYHDLLDELRCLVCANQSLSDSNAGLAKDLRGKVHEMVADGAGRGEIVEYMVARYGEYVLYRPRFSPANFFLWFAPVLAALVGFGFILAVAAGKFRRRRYYNGSQSAPYSAEQLQKARALLNDEEGQ